MPQSVGPKSVSARALPELRAGGYDRQCSTVQFYSRVQALALGAKKVLDFGAGRGVGHIDDKTSYREHLRKLNVEELVGVDVDPVVLTNPSLTSAFVLDKSGRIPFPEDYFDLIYADWTFEHLPDPLTTCRELSRVLKPGGWICARTPNRRGYIALFNRLIPEKLRSRVLKNAQPARKDEDIFPAVYLLNTKAAVAKCFPAENFNNVCYYWDASPAYHFGRMYIFRFFQLVHLLSPPPLRTIIMIFVQKKLKAEE